VIDRRLECALVLAFFEFDLDCRPISVVLDLLHVLAQLEEVIALVPSLRHQVLTPDLVCIHSCF
jgi:hypothetical protein